MAHLLPSLSAVVPPNVLCFSRCLNSPARSKLSWASVHGLTSLLTSMSNRACVDGITLDAAASAAAAAATAAAAAAAPATTTGVPTGTTPGGAAAGVIDPPNNAGSSVDEEEATPSEAARLATADAAVAAAAAAATRRAAAGTATPSSAEVIAALSRDLAAANARLGGLPRPAANDGDLDDEGYASVYPSAGPLPRPTRSALQVEPAGGRRARRSDNDERNARDRFDDGFDNASLPDGADDVLAAFSIPICVERRDGLPVPFSPEDTRHAATFTAGSRDEYEARAWYQSLAWTERLSNTLQAYLYGDDAVDDAELATLLLSARRIYALGAARYDFLALRQTEPGLADAFAHATAVPRNTLRGSSARDFLARVARAEVYASAKIGAAARGFRAPTRDRGGALQRQDGSVGGSGPPRGGSPLGARHATAPAETDDARGDESRQ